MSRDELSGGAPRPAASGLRRVVRGLIIALVVYGAVVVIGGARADRAAVLDAGSSFLGMLRAGDVDAAYEALSARRRAAMSRAAFAALVDHPALLGHTSATLHSPETESRGRCTTGRLVVADARWAIELFYIKEDDVWRVHSFGIQAPARVQLGTLIAECGYWSGTTVGYSGPPVERVTPPTAR